MEKINFDELYDALTDEQKAKINACETSREVIELLGQMDVSLPDELLAEVAGGISLWERTCQLVTGEYIPVPPKYPCPKCGSWNVGNYDKGDFYIMRVVCRDCGFRGCRDGSTDW